MANWIQGAIKKPGALTKTAKKAGMSPMAYARAHKKSKGLAGKRSRLAIQLASFARRGAFKKSK